MTKIWIFGDSYAADEIKESKSWTKYVWDEFPEYDWENLAVPSSSLDYLYYIYEQKRTNFNTGDIVIITLTTLERIFLRYRTKSKRPRFMTVNQITPARNDDKPNPDELKPQEFFLGDTFNIEAHGAMMNVFLNALQYDVLTKNLKVIVIPIGCDRFLNRKNKENISIAITGYEPGSIDAGLTGVTKRQMESAFDLKGKFWFEVEECQEQDFKNANHLSPENNKILANKVIRNIHTNEAIDLTTEWVYK